MTCTRCHQPLSSDELLAPSRRLHWACALEETQEGMRARIADEQAREEAQRVASRRSLIELGRRHERAVVVAWLQEKAAECAATAQRLAAVDGDDTSPIVRGNQRAFSLLKATAGGIERGEHIDTEREGT